MEKTKKVFNYPPITNHTTNNLVTGTIPQSKGKMVEDELIVRIGTILPANDATARFIVNDTYIVTTGDAIGSLINGGRVLKQRLPENITQEAIDNLAKHGIYVDNADETKRPDFGEVLELVPITAPTLTNVALEKKVTWTAVTDAKGYIITANGRTVKTLIGNDTLEYVYGDVFVPTTITAIALANNLTKGNSKPSNGIKVTVGGTL